VLILPNVAIGEDYSSKHSVIYKVDT